MERSRETRVWVNGIEVLAPDTSNLMAVSQVYDLTRALRFGALNEITIQVDNSYPNSPYAAITTLFYGYRGDPDQLERNCRPL